MAEGSNSLWVGGRNFVIIRRGSSTGGRNNSGPSGKRAGRYRPGSAATRAFYDSPAGKIAGKWERENRRPWFIV